MQTTCLIVADAARARFMTLEVPGEPLLEGGPRLVEQEDLVNPDANLAERDAFSDRSGLGHASRAGAAHAFDDHRRAHEREIERRFARLVADEAERFVVRQQAARLLLVAEPRLLGTLRAEIDRRKLGRIEVQELGENLSRRPLQQIQSILALRGAVPPARPPAAAVYRPRGQAPAAG